MSRRRRVRIVEAAAALASDGTILINANQLGMGSTLAEIVAYAEATGLPIFVGVALAPSSAGWIIRELDDGVADVVGRLGSRIAPSKRNRRR